MIKTLEKIINMKATLWVNAFCYYFKRLWLIGKWMPDSIYSCYDSKKVLSVLAVIVRQLIDFFGKPLYLLCFVILPINMMSNSNPGMKGQEFAAMVNILFFLNCIIGGFGESQVFTVTRDKITCIKYLHMNARTYIQGFLAFMYIPFFLYYLVWLLIFGRFLGGTLLESFFLWVMLLAFRMIAEAFQLWLFDRTGKVISRSMIYSWFIIAIGLTGAYIPFVLGWNWPAAAILLHPVTVAILAALGGISLWYIIVGYKGYEKNYHHSIDLNFLLSTLLKSSGTASFKEVEIKETDAAVSETDKINRRNLKGYAYLNAIFFARHRRQLVKPVYYRLAIVVCIFAALVILFIVNRPLAVVLSQNITASLLPTLVFVMYFMTVADKACRAMFFNCDKDMLRYAYYRQPRVILRNFKIRFLWILRYNSVVAGTLCLAVMGFCLLCGTDILSMDIFLFCATVFLLAALFTAHHLCLYYIFQPYSENLQIKSPFYSAINMVIYMLSFMCLQVEQGGPAFTVVVLVFTMAYTAVALVLVYRMAPRTFRIK